MHHRTGAYIVFTWINNIVLVIISVLCLAPLVHILAVSFSSDYAASANLIKFWPIGFTFDGWDKTLNNQNFLISLWNGIYRAAAGTLVSLIVTVAASYSLSKESKEFKGRSIYVGVFVFTMLFNGGLIPTYILIRNLGLLNSYWALILPVAVNVWNLLIILNFFRNNVPKALEEAAYIDGAGHFRTLIYVYLPLSMPVLATISLYTIVFHWNSWFDALIYIADAKKYPLSSFLQTIIVQRNVAILNVTDPEQLKSLSERTVRSAQIFIGALPIILIYPFLQKYFIQGTTLGSVKE